MAPSAENDRQERRLRACLTDAEWRRFHVLAAARGLTLQDCLTELILDALKRESD